MIPVFMCPSSPQGNVAYQSNPTRYRTDYAAVTSVDSALATAGLVDTVGNYNGLLQWEDTRNMRPLSHCTDGLSNTIAYAEDAGRPDLFQYGKQTGSGVSGACWADFDQDYGLNGAPPSSAGGSNSCPINCTNDNEIYSFHTGGAYVLMGDGSVRFLQQNVNIRIVAAMITARGAEAFAMPD
jgi:prepilin-type processing-associated H-X9-DG protein